MFKLIVLPTHKKLVNTILYGYQSDKHSFASLVTGKFGKIEYISLICNHSYVNLNI